MPSLPARSGPCRFSSCSNAARCWEINLFVTVTKAAYCSVVRTVDAKELRKKEKIKNKGWKTFYRFQMHERKEEEQDELLRKFEEDKRRISDMKKKRGWLR
jgi:ribosomal RNA-processing protein 7